VGRVPVAQPSGRKSLDAARRCLKKRPCTLAAALSARHADITQCPGSGCRRSAWLLRCAWAAVPSYACCTLIVGGVGAQTIHEKGGFALRHNEGASFGM